MTGDYDWKIYDEVEKSSKLQAQILQQLGKNNQDLTEQNRQLLEAFNKVAEELRLLREELAPKTLDKSKNASPLKRDNP